MKVGLVSAPSDNPTFRAPETQVDPPLGILSLATMIKDQHEVRLFDGQLSTHTPQRLAREVLAWQPDVVGFSVNYSTVARTSRKMAEHIRAMEPGLPIIFGGNFSTFHWPRLIKLPYVDYVALHEAESGFPQFLARLQDPDLPLPSGLVQKTPDGLCGTRPSASYVEDLDCLPFCDYDLFDDPTKYVKSIVSSRGCPYTCIYCSTKEMWGNWRSRSAQNVAAEMLALAEKYNADRVLFADDTFLVSRKRVLGLCALLQSEGSPVRWGFSTRLETVDEGVIPKLARAGCRWIFFGVESGSDRVLREMKRHYTRVEAIRKIKVCAENGITCSASFMIGLPWETEADVRETFRTMQQVATHRVLLSIFTPLSGTLSLQRPQDYGIEFIEPPDPERTVVGHGYVGFNTRYLTAKRIRELWLEGQGIVIGKGRQESTLEAEIERNRFGLLGEPTGTRPSSYKGRHSACP